MRASTPRRRPASIPTARDRLACLALSLAAGLALPARAHAQASSAQQTESRERFQRGRAFYDAHRWSDAVDEFRQSLELSSSPNTRLLIARALREMGGHTAEAYREFLAAGSEAEARASSEPRYAPIVGAARAEAQALIPLISQLRIQITDPPPDTTVRLDGTVVPRSEWNSEIAVEPGRHTVEAAAAGRQTFERVWTLEAGHVALVEVTLGIEISAQAGGVEVPTPRLITAAPTPVYIPVTMPLVPLVPLAQPPATSGLTTAGGVAIGLGVVAMVAGGISGAVSLNVYSRLQIDCGGARCPATVTDAQARVDLGRTAGTVFTAGLVAGGVLVIAGAVMYAAGRAEDRRVPEVLGRVWFDPLTGMAGLRGAF
ncbi:MAG: hypothetical protein WCJ30_26440 [Deltaproteobacteria bacterium]